MEVACDPLGGLAVSSVGFARRRTQDLGRAHHILQLSSSPPLRAPFLPYPTPLSLLTMAPPPSKGKKRSADDSSKPAHTKKAKAAVPEKQPQMPKTIPTTATTGPPTLPYKSSLLTDDVDFPRGGGSTLTPYEHKEALNEARKEADADARVEVSQATYLRTVCRAQDKD